MYGRYAQELGTYAKEEAARFRAAGVRNQTPDQLEYEKDPCVKCQSESKMAVPSPVRDRPRAKAGIRGDLTCVFIFPYTHLTVFMSLYKSINKENY